MKRHSVLIILLVMFWFIGTNHCAFGICPPKNVPVQHEHGGEGSHPCGTPCNIGAVLSSSQDSITKVVVFPDQIIGAVLSFLINSISTLEPFIISRSSETSNSPQCLTLISALTDAPNAPPALHA